MIWLATKKRMKESFDNLKASILTLTFACSNNKIVINKNKESIASHSKKIARLEGMMAVLINNNPQNLKGSREVSDIPSKSPRHIETQIINRVRRNKKALTMAEISKLAPSHSVIEMFEEIVLNKGICSKASYYRYIAELKSQKEILVRQK